MKSIKNPIAKTVALLTVLAIFASGYWLGFRSGHYGASKQTFQIHGDSMQPTLAGDTLCEVVAAMGPLRIGDVVAVRWDGRDRIKRIAALGGDVVDLSEGRLTVNSQRLEDLIAQRSKTEFLRPAWVPVSDDQTDWHRCESQPQWLVYHHFNPHAGDRLTAVMDDYPTNTAVRRNLNPVDRLALRITPGKTMDQIADLSDIQIAFYRAPDFIDVINPTRSVTPARDASAVSGSSLSTPDLDASHPIAVRIPAAVGLPLRLQVLREIEYRDDRPSGRVSYPIRLDDDQVFVVGDNVPVSIDSRSVGPIGRDQIIGRVQQASP
ncbi:S26 family signal peptidase [Stieleria sp. TO1_6]|uniref:S26 family signal peptidase n=1 Tax=Stieleria tagensis TaxID=2956795 RepID=UPI00209AB8F6|nr:S26 family signal peptidase [Stieleria tagensis]MCO8125381.1 S26 family signal peptidase [Stieleria tagensis]